MIDSMHVGERVTHYKFGKGVVVSLLSQGLAEVRFGKQLEYVEQKNLISLDQKDRERKRKAELSREKAQEREEAERERAALEALRKKHEAKRNDLLQKIRQQFRKDFIGSESYFRSISGELISGAEFEQEKVSFVKWRNSRHLDPDEGYPGIRYAMLHTLSHLLIRELALECGYNAASIRERIYADTSGQSPQAGILIYTAAADSDGTLGGLVDLGKPENLGRLLEQALNRSKICSSDPLCSEHDPQKDRSLHAAACHACSLVAETSCERGNRYLDRSLLVPTLERVDAAFFKGL